MDTPNYKKKIIVIIVLIIVLILIVVGGFYLKKYLDNKKGLTPKQMNEAMLKLHEESTKIPTLPPDQKQKVMDDFAKDVGNLQDNTKTTPVAE